MFYALCQPPLYLFLMYLMALKVVVCVLSCEQIKIKSLELFLIYVQWCKYGFSWIPPFYAHN